jgi:hypothetical protein
VPGATAAPAAKVPPADGTPPPDKPADNAPSTGGGGDVGGAAPGGAAADNKAAPVDETQELREALKKGLVGLALSGGGIRSATFNLGLLQGLAAHKLLGLIDYLSTVSGGGFIGGWLTAWISRPPLAGVPSPTLAVQQFLADDRPGQDGNPQAALADREEYPQIRHLRRYSNYLAPRQGFFTADTWALWATYLRNFLLNQLVLLPAIVVVLLVIRLTLLLYYPWESSGEEPWSWSSDKLPKAETVRVMFWVAGLIGVVWLVTLVMIIWGTLQERRKGQKPDSSLTPLTPLGMLGITAALLVGGVLLCAFAPYPLVDRLPQGLTLLPSPTVGLDNVPTGVRDWRLDLARCLLFCATVAFLGWLFTSALRPSTGRQSQYQGALAFGGAFLAGLVGGPLVCVADGFLISPPFHGPGWKELLLFSGSGTALAGLLFLFAAALRRWWLLGQKASTPPGNGPPEDPLSWAIRSLGWVCLACLVGMLLFSFILYHCPRWVGERLNGPEWPTELAQAALSGLFVAGLVFLLAALLCERPSREWNWSQGRRPLGAACLVGLAFGALLYGLLYGVRCLLPPPNDLIPDSLPWAKLLSFALLCTCGVGLSVLLALTLQWWAGQKSDRPLVAIKLVGASLAGLVGGVLLFGVYYILHHLYAWDGLLSRDYIRVRATARVLTLGPPLVLGVIVLAVYLGVGLHKGGLTEGLREWWSSLCARLLVAAALWLAVNLVALYGTALVLWAGPRVGAALGSGWLLTVATGVLAGRGPRTGARVPRNRALEWLARLAPSVFLAGLLIAVSLLLHIVIDHTPQWRKADEKIWLQQTEPERPPTRVFISGKPGEAASREESTERAEVINDAAIIQQMYWAGILNTSPHFIPKVMHYKLDQQDLDQLRKDGFPDALIERLAQPPLFGCTCPTRERFEKELDPVLLQCQQDVPGATSYVVRHTIIQHAKKLQSLELNPPDLFRKLLKWLVGASLVLVVAMWMVDVNLFSLHELYHDRLVRCYLGASRYSATPPSAGGTGHNGESGGAALSTRCPDPVTGLDFDDDIDLKDLNITENGYDGPYLIVNTALNLVHGKELDWQERKAESFVLTPLYCGSRSTGYRLTADGYGGTVSLGMAVTLSGAAASPNMGYHSSPSVTALLTVFNARLGAWLGNPASPTHWQRGGPSFGFAYLLRELFGRTLAEGGYVYLSDGGHFENLGAYELVRRRCRYVIVSDATEDGRHSFEDLGNLIRKCRVDFGIDIEIDLEPLSRNAQGRSRWHCAVGRIRYDKVDDRLSAPGTLIYIKPSLTGDEPADVLHYAERHPAFPHEPTANQFYSESQFESYRALGMHVADAVFRQSVEEMQEELAREQLTRERPSQRRQCQSLFSSIERRWFAMPPQYESAFLESTRAFLRIQDTLRRDGHLCRLSLDLYPELDVTGELTRRLLGNPYKPEARASRRRAELHVILSMLQVMENAWLSLNLDVTYAHPMNRGWMDVFYRWANAETVRKHWPVLRSELARGFVSFCERQMMLGEVLSQLVPIRPGQDTPPGFERVWMELQDQWPVDPWNLRVCGRITRRPKCLDGFAPGFADIQNRLESASTTGEHLGLLVYTRNPYPPEKPLPPESHLMPCGIILLSPTMKRDALELFVWLRGAYRNSGIGRSAVRELLGAFDQKRRTDPSPTEKGGTPSDPLTVLREFAQRLRTGENHDPPLRVRLPIGELKGPGGEMQRRMWLTFFYNHGFEKIGDIEVDGQVWEVVLERNTQPS